MCLANEAGMAELKGGELRDDSAAGGDNDQYDFGTIDTRTAAAADCSPRRRSITGKWPASLRRPGPA